MRLELTGRHVPITPAVRTIVEKQLAATHRLLNDSVVAPNNDRHPANRGIMSLTNSKTVDVKAATRKQPRNMSQYTKTIFYENRNYVFH